MVRIPPTKSIGRGDGLRLQRPYGWKDKKMYTGIDHPIFLDKDWHRLGQKAQPLRTVSCEEVGEKLCATNAARVLAF